MNPKIKELRKKAMQLPLTPGVYLMKNRRSEIISVGKAKALKNRVSQYFGSEHNHTVKVRKMVENVDDFDVILTDSEFEALVLECSLIKQHSPKYNILLKDDKGYSYIKVTPGKWRNIYAVLQREDDGAKYIGPYMSSFAARNTVDEAKKIFRLPQCNKVFPRDFGKSRPCLNFFIGQCSGVCSGKVPFSPYNEAVEDALAFIKEGGTAALADLQKRMEDAAENLEFEKAARLRDRIAAIKRLGGKQKVMSADVREQDVFALVTGAASSGKACLSVLRFADGRLYDSENFITDVPEDTAETLAELIRSFYMIRDFVPRRVSVDGEVADSELLERWLSERKGKKVIISHSTAGEQKKLFEMCRSNAAQYLTPLTGTAGRKTAALDELAGMLGLPAAPEFIESYDISHTAGSDNVAGMIVFRNGEPYRRGYRRFMIKGFTGQDDYTVNHLVSAEDIAIMSRELLRHETILQYTSIWMDTIRNGAFGLSNTNRLIRFYPGATGLKTGSTSKSGLCISATARRDGRHLIAVIMGSPTREIRNEMAKKLLDWGFSSFAMYRNPAAQRGNIRILGGTVEQCAVEYGEFTHLMKKGTERDVVYEIMLPESAAAPLHKGDAVGKIVYRLGEEILGEADIVAAEDVEKISFTGLLGRMLRILLLRP